MMLNLSERRTPEDFQYPLSTGLPILTASVDGLCRLCLAAWPCVSCPTPDQVINAHG